MIVDFWAPWCGPCKTLQPMIEKVVKEAKGAVKLVKIDIDKNQMLAQQLRIQSIPAVYAFFGGRPVDGFMGAVPESQVKDFVDRLIQASGGAAGGAGNEIAELLEHAKAAVAQNDMETAAQIYSEILGVEPDERRRRSPAWRATTSQAGDVEQAKDAARPGPGQGARTTPTSWPCRPRSISPSKAKEAGPVDDLKAKAAADPKDFQARLDLAMAYWAGDQKQEAIDELLAMIKADRNWNEDAARAAAAEVLRGAGLRRSAGGRRPQAAVDDPVFLRPS